MATSGERLILCMLCCCFGFLWLLGRVCLTLKGSDTRSMQPFSLQSRPQRDIAICGLHLMLPCHYGVKKDQLARFVRLKKKP